MLKQPGKCILSKQIALHLAVTSLPTSPTIGPRNDHRSSKHGTF